MTRIFDLLTGVCRFLLCTLANALHFLSHHNWSGIRSCFFLECLYGQDILVKAFNGLVMLVPALVLLSLITLSGSFWLSLVIAFLFSSLLLLFQSKLKIPFICLSV